MINEIMKDVKHRMDGAIKHFGDELKTFRTGRASIAILDAVTAPYYGQEVPLNQVANLSTPDPTLILIQPWEQPMLGEIERAILKADLGLNPVNDGRVLKVPIPALTEEHRQNLIKKAHTLAEDTRNIIRKIRRDGNDDLKKAEKDKEISEDEMHRGLKQIQEIHDDFIKKVEEILEKKETEITGD